MRIKIPAVIADVFDKIHEWGYTPLYTYKGYSLRRVDPLIAIAAAFCFTYYYATGGFLAGVTGLLMFIFVGMVVLWIL